ncbi:MAG: FG-GAP repeat domain-containing protein [Acidiferrobacterales bacterium]
MTRLSVVFLLLFGRTSLAMADSLTISEIESFPQEFVAMEKPEQLPQSRVARGSRDIATVWLAGATNRYQHGVLGDDLEASRLVIELRDGKTLDFELPVTRVFEDLEPRLADLDGDNVDEILVVESDTHLGASLAVYAVVGNKIIRRAATPFLGRSNRWLNPVGVGDFDADGRLDIVLVATPHIGGILRLYRFTIPTLSQFAEVAGVSNHRIGSTELGLGQVVSGSDRDRLLVPDQSRRSLILFEWSSSGLRELTRVTLPAPVSSSLKAVSRHVWRFRLQDGRHMEVRLDCRVYHADRHCKLVLSYSG